MEDIAFKGVLYCHWHTEARLSYKAVVKASVQLLTGCLEWADTCFPLYFLGFLVKLPS